jgi:mitofilin
MKAAALLITLTQFRKTLKRDNESFESDLALLDRFSGDDPELALAIDQLAPRAEEGVLSVDGLKDNFKGLAGDIVVASLSGEEISVQEKAKARLTDIIKVEKDGELISGTDTQATVDRAQKLLDQGDVEGALKELQSLDGEAAEVARPWVEEAEYTIMAQQLQDMIGIDLLSQFQNNEGSPLEIKGQPITNITNDLKSSLPTGGKLVRDEASGVSILTPGIKFPKTDSFDLNNN